MIAIKILSFNKPVASQIDVLRTPAYVLNTLAVFYYLLTLFHKNKLHEISIKHRYTPSIYLIKKSYRLRKPIFTLSKTSNKNTV